MNQLVINPSTTNEVSINLEINGFKKGSYKKTNLIGQKIIYALVIAGSVLIANPEPGANMRGVQVSQVSTSKQITIKTDFDNKLNNKTTNIKFNGSQLSVREIGDVNIPEFVDVNSLKNIDFSTESVLSTNKIVYNIENHLIKGFLYTTIGGMGAWMEGIKDMRKKLNIPKSSHVAVEKQMRTKLTYSGPIDNALINDFVIKDDGKIIISKPFQTENSLKTKLVYAGSLANEPL